MVWEGPGQAWPLPDSGGRRRRRTRKGTSPTSYLDPPGPRRRSSARASPTRARTRDHQHLLEGATPAERSLAPTQRRAAQARRDRRGRCRARARRLLLGDRHLPHHEPRTDTHPNDPQETQQLTLTNPVSTHPVAVSEAAPAIPARVQHSAFRRLSTHPAGGRARL